MDAFGYLSVLLSIILGLAITQLLQGVRGIALARGRVRLYWPSLALAGLLFVVFVQSWWAMFELRNHQGWTFPQFFVVIVHTVLLYLQSALVFPDFTPDELDLRTHYFAQSRLFFSVAVLGTLASVGKDLALAGTLPERGNLAFHLFFAAIAVGAAVTRKERFHKAVALMAMATFSLYVALLFTRLR
jgi:hypothetical protein